MNEIDLPELMSDWQFIRRNERGMSVRTACLFPSGSVVSLSIQPYIGGWIVSDEGASIFEAAGTGASPERNLKRAENWLMKRGLRLENGRVLTNSVPTAELPPMVALVASSCAEVSKLLGQTTKSRTANIKNLVSEVLKREFAEALLPNPLVVLGASEKVYKFENVVRVGNSSRLAISPVPHSDSAIKSNVVISLDVKRAKVPELLLHSVFDDNEPWLAEELDILKLGSPPVPFSELSKFISRQLN